MHLMPDIFSEKSILYLLPVISNTACYCVLQLITACYFLAVRYCVLRLVTVSLACTTDDIGVKGISF